MGIVNGRHMAQIARAVYTPWTKYPLWLMMELAIIGSDIQEVCHNVLHCGALCGSRHALTPYPPRTDHWDRHCHQSAFQWRGEAVTSRQRAPRLRDGAHPRPAFVQVPIYAGVLITGADAFTFLLLEQMGGLRRLEYFFG